MPKSKIETVYTIIPKSKEIVYYKIIKEHKLQYNNYFTFILLQLFLSCVNKPKPTILKKKRFYALVNKYILYTNSIKF